MKKRTGGTPSGEKRGSHVYVPETGHLVWFSFSPQAGREQAGRRPALVLSPRSYNARAGLCLICPITSQVKDYPFEVPLPDGLPFPGSCSATTSKAPIGGLVLLSTLALHLPKSWLRYEQS